ncbi:MAG: hypothetical protein M1834_008904 [Cirrosporium novae-zelandiae]|nr:MAG: hypothetical protein M1834_008904 [Cirrosporium novae-zelandiae]
MALQQPVAINGDPIAQAREDETDSSIDDSESSLSATATLNSEAVNYQYKHGRRYHSYKAGRYDLPNDEAEQDRLDLQHEIWIEMLGDRLQAAPVPDDVQDVLDVATGTGNWAIDFADRHPSARVIGVDLSPIQPTWVPPNCTFEIDDAEAPWTYSHKFDFIHGRTLTLGWRDWDNLCTQSLHHLRPNGWLEVDEFTYPTICDCTPGTHATPALHSEYLSLITTAAAKRGVHMQTAQGMAARFRRLGFVNVEIKTMKMYLAHDKFRRDVMNGLEGFALAFFTEQLGWSKARVEEYVGKVREAILEDGKGAERGGHGYGYGHAYVPIWAVWGQKPAGE